MAYCQLADLQNALRADALIALTDDADTGQVNQAVINEAIARGDSIIDSYCAGRYLVPFAAPAPDEIRMLSEDLAIYHLFARRGEEIPGSVEDKYKNAVQALRDISKGLRNLGSAESAAMTVTEEPEIGISTDAANRVFTDVNSPDTQNGSTLGGY